MTGFEIVELPVDRVGFVPEDALEQITETLYFDHSTNSLFLQEADRVIHIGVARHQD